jgi:hypothetical protein
MSEPPDTVAEALRLLDRAYESDRASWNYALDELTEEQGRLFSEFVAMLERIAEREKAND